MNCCSWRKKKKTTAGLSNSPVLAPQVVLNQVALVRICVSETEREIERAEATGFVLVFMGSVYCMCPAEIKIFAHVYSFLVLVGWFWISVLRDMDSYTADKSVFVCIFSVNK